VTYCANCGSPVEGQFCPKCGTAVGSPGPAGADPQFQPHNQTVPPAGAVPPAGTASAGLQENVAAALCYLLGFITGIIFLVLTPYNQNKLIRFHAFQSILVSVAYFILQIAFGVILPFPMYITLMPLLALLAFLLWLFLMYKAYSNQKVVLPLVGPIAEQQA
jgi:uncharacterized membrane protein